MRYRLYTMSGSDPVVRTSEIDCPNDDAAIGKVIDMPGILGLEMWRDMTLIIRLDPATTRLTIGPTVRGAA
jgi:hypothetical protein